MKKYLFLLPIFVSLVLAGSVSAQDFDLIVCDGSAAEPCTFAHLITLAQNVIRALILLSTFLAVIAFIYTGFLLLTAGGNESKKTRAKEIFKNVFIGYLWIVAAWLIVYTITNLLEDGFSLLEE